MKKSLLKKIPVIDIKKEWVKLIEQFKHTDIDYLIKVEKELIRGKNIIILNFIDKAYPKEVSYRVFINKEDYITQDFTFKPMKWKTGCLYNLLGWNWYNYCVLADDESHNILKGFLRKKEDLLEEINLLQYEIMDIRLARKHQIIKDRIDNKMKNVPRLPNNFKRWINDTALYHSRYIYYEYKPRKFVNGYCTHCKSDLILERDKGVRHNNKGICPKCKSPITFKAKGRAGNIFDYGEAALIQKAGDELVVRYFKINKDYGIDYRNPRLTYKEYARDFYNKEGKVEQYEWARFKQTEEVRWCDAISRTWFFYSNKYLFYDTVLYEKNLDEVLKETIWEYSALKEYATHKKGFGFPVWAYLNKYKEIPQIEYLVKLKLYKLVSSVIYYSSYYYRDEINLDGSNLYEVLNIENKDQLRIAQRLDVGLGELRVIRETGKVNIKLTDEEILFVTENVKVDRIVEISKYTTFHKMMKYVKSQLSEERINIDYIFSDWQDYIRDCKVLGYDLSNEFILFPRDLAKAHEETYKLIKDNRSELINSAITKIYNDLNREFSWRYKDIVIIPPKSSDEIINEGHVLCHCVGRYVEDIARGQTIILFLRKKKEINKPFYTIEINPSNLCIKQCRGKDNKSMDDDIEKIVNRFEKEILMPMNLKEAV